MKRRRGKLLGARVVRTLEEYLISKASDAVFRKSLLLSVLTIRKGYELHTMNVGVSWFTPKEWVLGKYQSFYVDEGKRMGETYHVTPYSWNIGVNWYQSKEPDCV